MHEAVIPGFYRSGAQRFERPSSTVQPNFPERLELVRSKQYVSIRSDFSGREELRPRLSSPVTDRTSTRSGANVPAIAGVRLRNTTITD